MSKKTNVVCCKSFANIREAHEKRMQRGIDDTQGYKDFVIKSDDYSREDNVLRCAMAMMSGQRVTNQGLNEIESLLWYLNAHKFWSQDSSYSNVDLVELNRAILKIIRQEVSTVPGQKFFDYTLVDFKTSGLGQNGIYNHGMMLMEFDLLLGQMAKSRATQFNFTAQHLKDAEKKMHEWRPHVPKPEPKP